MTSKEVFNLSEKKTHSRALHRDKIPINYQENNIRISLQSAKCIYLVKLERN